MSSLDTQTLQLLRRRDRYEQMARAIPARALDVRTKALLDDFGRFFRDFPDAQDINGPAFKVMFRSVHPLLPVEDVTVYEKIIDVVLNGTVPPDIEAGLMKRLAAAATAYDIAQDIAAFNEGREIDLRRAVEARVEEYDKFVQRQVKNPQVLDAIEDLLSQQENHRGIKFRAPWLNSSIKPLEGGDFVILAARPDKGKTSFWCDELPFMASQLDAFWPDEKRSVLWFNNEGPGRRIVTRLFQGALGATIEELSAWSHQPATGPRAEQFKTLVRQKYAEAIGGRLGALRVMDIHDYWNYEVEDVIKQFKPGVILFDMIDNIKFGGEVANNGQRTDQLLEAMYQWARMMGVKYDCIILANSQLSADADGVQYPTLPQLKDSKTGKQGAADVIITMGAVNDPMLENSRYFGCTKNKKVPTNGRKSPMVEVLFDSHRCRFNAAP